MATESYYQTLLYNMVDGNFYNCYYNIPFVDYVYVCIFEL